MVVVILTTLLLFVVDVLTKAPEPLMRRPLIPSSGKTWEPKVSVLWEVHKADLFLKDVRPHLHKARGIEGIENMVYSRTSYNVLLDVGSIPFEMALDTGSSDLWLVSDGCHTVQCKDVPAYPLTSYASPTFSAINTNQTSFHVSFTDSTSASGFVARETVRMGSIQLPGQALGFVLDTNVTLGQSVSGILGLGFPRLSQIAGSLSNAPPFFGALAELGILTYPLFGMSLKLDTSGTLSMGAVDASIVSNASRISWHEVVPFAPLPNENATTAPLYLHWALPLTKITVNNTAIVLHPSYPNITGPSPLALLDIGTNGIYGPFTEVASIFLALGTIRQVTPGGWGLPCDITSTMTFSFAGTNITLQPSDYLIGPTLGDPKLCLSWPMASAPSPDGLDWHLGTPFLRKVYTVFSFGISGHEPPLIGLYPLSNSSSLADNSSSISSIFSSLSATVTTTAPSVLLPTSTYSTPAYIFNTSATLPTIGQVLPSQSDLGASTYSPLFKQPHDNTNGLATLTNATALPKISPPASLVTLFITDAAGAVHTTTSTASPIPTAFLGKPPGSRNGAPSLYQGVPPWFWILPVILLTTVWS